jgi:hypothetical protein
MRKKAKSQSRMARLKNAWCERDGAVGIVRPRTPKEAGIWIHRAWNRVGRKRTDGEIR